MRGLAPGARTSASVQTECPVQQRQYKPGRVVQVRQDKTGRVVQKRQDREHELYEKRESVQDRMWGTREVVQGSTNERDTRASTRQHRPY